MLTREDVVEADALDARGRPISLGGGHKGPSPNSSRGTAPPTPRQARMCAQLELGDSCCERWRSIDCDACLSTSWSLASARLWPCQSLRNARPPFPSHHIELTAESIVRIARPWLSDSSLKVRAVAVA
jgi:hypothetical protein